MSSCDFVLISMVLVAVGGLLIVATWNPPRPAGEAPPQVSRWKRFRIRPAAFRREVGGASPAIAEEPSGMRLSSELRGRRLTLAGGHGRPRANILRSWLPFRWRYRVLVGRSHHMDVVVPKKGGSPEIRPVPPMKMFHLRGCLEEREYEVCRNGRVVAIVSWQRPREDEPLPESYVLEVVQTEDPLPIVALVATVEWALQGRFSASPAQSR